MDLRYRKLGRNRVFLVLWEISENQFSQPKKRLTKFSIFFENPPPLEKILDPSLIAGDLSNFELNACINFRWYERFRLILLAKSKKSLKSLEQLSDNNKLTVFREAAKEITTGVDFKTTFDARLLSISMLATGEFDWLLMKAAFWLIN